MMGKEEMYFYKALICFITWNPDFVLFIHFLHNLKKIYSIHTLVFFFNLKTRISCFFYNLSKLQLECRKGDNQDIITNDVKLRQQ